MGRSSFAPMSVAEPEVISAQEAAATWDCSSAGCPHPARKRGPGGNPYCDDHLSGMMEKKKRTISARRAGIAVAGSPVDELLVARRADLATDRLTQRLALEMRSVDRVRESLRDPELLPRAKREAAATIRELVLRLSQV